MIKEPAVEIAAGSFPKNKKIKVMRIILSFLVLALVLSLFSSCKRDGTDLSTTPSQLWLKVNNNVPEFSIEFIGQDAKNYFNSYSITYSNNELSPNLKTTIDNTKNETWVMVYKSLDKTDEISIQFSGESKTYKSKGFGHGEKRFVEISCNSGGVITVQDRDITTITKIIWIE
jgi:hypothetical protein